MTSVFLTHSSAMRKNYYDDRALKALRDVADVRLNPTEGDLNPDQLVEAAQGCEIIVGARIPEIPATTLEQLPDLVAFCRVAVDVRNIDIEAASRLGILVTRATPGFGPSVAEWILGVMIDLSRGITNACISYRTGVKPDIAMGRQLKGATLGIIGFGTIGQYLAGLGQALGMNVIFSDPYQSAGVPGVEQCAFAAVLAQSDFVVCLAAATPETENMMNAAAFAQMKPSAYFINASRGELVNDYDLVQALEQGRIAGCALDVGRDQDQMPSALLAQHRKVIASPHIGGLTPEAALHQAMDTVGQVRSILAGRMPDGAMNAAHAHRLAHFQSEMPNQMHKDARIAKVTS